MKKNYGMLWKRGIMKMIEDLLVSIYADEDCENVAELEDRIKELMRKSFLAGFSASGEGFNGEYPDKDLTEALNKRFDLFIELLETQK